MKKRLFKQLFLGLFILLPLASCNEVERNKIEGVDFSYQFYVKETSTPETLLFHKKEYDLGDKIDNTFFRGAIWTKITLNNNSNLEKTIVIATEDCIHLNYSIHQFDPEKNTLKLISGIKEKGFNDGRSFHFHQPNFKVRLAPKSNNCYYLSSSSDGRVIRPTPFITTLEDYLSTIRKINYVHYFFFSILIVIFLINILFWFIFKNKIHGFYSTYILTTLLLYVGMDGYFYYSGINYHLIDHIVFIVLKISLFTLVLFSLTFLKIKELNPTLYRRIRKISYGLLFGLLTYQLIWFQSSIRYLHVIENFTSFIWISLIFAMIFTSFKEKRPELKYYLFALFTHLLFLIIGLIIPYINVLNGLDLTFVSIFKIGTILEVIIFTYTTVKVLGIQEQTHVLNNATQLITQLNITSENKVLKAKLREVNMSKMEFSSILKLIENNLNNEEQWKLFKNKVNEINPSFLSNLLAENNNLSKNDLRLLVLVKLKFTQKEISNLLCIAEASVKKSKQRVRKKLKLSFDVKLYDFLLKF